ncbi:MAG: hypothetical protein M3Y04_00560 [Actinomycetota bacterium]|nr:hypothetical protein [Actinomycetota bacterium]
MVGIAGAALVAGVGVQVAGADGGLTLTPGRGAPGTSFRVEVTCGQEPLVYRRNLQDDPVQGTIGSYPSDELDQTSPSVWTLDQVAGKADALYYATCAKAGAGEARFDAKAPHLWFGPRPRLYTLDPRTRAEGTDCPAGTTAKVAIEADGQRRITEATIDEYGDWSVPLPAPVGAADLTVSASCGDVVYDALSASSTTTTRIGQAPEQPMPAPAPPASATMANAPPAVATGSSPNYTG